MKQQQQKIYGRWEYPLSKDETFIDLARFYTQNKIFRKDGVQVGGISCASDVSNHTAILMTYDVESELMLRLKFFGDKKVTHLSFYVN